MKIRLKDNTVIPVSRVSFSKGNFGQYGYRAVIVIGGTVLGTVTDELELKKKFRDENIQELTIIREIDGDTETVEKTYNFISLVDFSHHITDFEEKIEIIISQENPEEQEAANEEV